MAQWLQDKEGDFIQSFEQGEEKAYDFLFRRYFPALCFYAGKMLPQTQDAEDIVQDSFIQLWKRRNQLRDLDKIKNYLYTTVKNGCINFLKKKKLVLVEVLLPEVAADNLEAMLITAETINELHQEIGQLPARMREVVKLYYLEGMSYKQIGAIMDTDPETVRNQRGKAIKLIRKTIIPG